MKTFFSALFFLPLFFTNGDLNFKLSEGYVIKGSVKGIKTGMVKMSTHNEDDRTSKVIDSARIQNGIFELKGSASPQMVTINIEPGNWSFNIFLENSSLIVKADTTGSDYFDYTKYGSTKGARINMFTESGSKYFDDLMKYQNDPGQKKYDALFKEIGKKIETTKDIDEQYKYRDQNDSLRKILNAGRQEKINQYISKNPNSVAGAYMLRDLYNWYSDLPLDDMISMSDKFQGEAKKSNYYESLQGIIAKRNAVAVGSIAPDFTLLKRDSSQLTLSSTRGKYMMIDFWASWCHPCRQAIPHWKEVYAKYHAKGFDIVSVSDDSKWKDWFKAMDVEKMPWMQVCDEFPIKNMPAKVGSLYMTTYIPFYVLLDKDGKILVYSGDQNKIDEKLKEIFGS